MNSFFCESKTYNLNRVFWYTEHMTHLNQLFLVNQNLQYSVAINK